MSYASALSAAILNSLRPAASTVRLPNVMQLSEGQVIKASVQRVVDSTVLLDIAGQTVAAHTEIPLEPRQQVLLNVTSLNDNQITLQLVEPGGQTTASANGAATTGAEAQLSQIQNLEALLTSWGLEADAPNLALAKNLLIHGQTVTPQDVLSARAAWQALPNAQPADLEALAYLQANNLPTGEEAVALAKHWLQGLPPIANRLNTLQQSLQQSLGQLQQAMTAAQTDGQPQSAALRQLTATLQSTLAQIASWPVGPDTPATEIAARLNNLAMTLATPPEASLAKQAEVIITQGQPQPAPETAAENQPVAAQSLSNAAPPPADGPSGPQAGPSTPAPTQAAQPDAPQAAPAPHIAPKDAPPAAKTASSAATPADAPPTGAAKEASSSTPLHHLQKLIADTLADTSLDKPAAQALHHLSNELQALSKDLGSVQLSNLSTMLHPAEGQAYLLPIPLNTPDGPRTAQLKIYSQPGHTRIDPENTRLALLLDLPSLGEIAIDLTVFRKQIMGRILSGRPETQSLVKTELGDLRERLNDIGYHVETLVSDLLKPKAAAEGVAPASPGQSAAGGPHLRLDVSV